VKEVEYIGRKPPFFIRSAAANDADYGCKKLLSIRILWSFVVIAHFLPIKML
jgi:hypothetical protein